MTKIMEGFKDLRDKEKVHALGSKSLFETVVEAKDVWLLCTFPSMLLNREMTSSERTNGSLKIRTVKELVVAGLGLAAHSDRHVFITKCTHLSFCPRYM